MATRHPADAATGIGSCRIVRATSPNVRDNRGEESRYRNTTRQKAEKLYAAITDNANGVMQWIRTRW
jgi:hypothetical protein